MRLHGLEPRNDLISEEYSPGRNPDMNIYIYIYIFFLYAQRPHQGLPLLIQDYIYIYMLAPPKKPTFWITPMKVD